ncbi:hypothetical protein BSKO_07525 [Bryopsis sp. KO-2023]|nr:hypothetical protein BSKO_07525 [Bryopsis sp. KO-2023]
MTQMAALVERLDGEEDVIRSNGVGHDGDASEELSELSSAEASHSDGDAGPDPVKERAKSGRGPKKSKSVVQGGKLLAEAFARTLHQTSKKDLRVLGKSQESLKRRREELDDAREAKARAKTRKEIVSRGRTKIPIPGEDANHDKKERELRKLATRGVVRLFNMVSKFKKQEITESKEKAAKNKKRFLSEMRKPLEQEEKQSKNKKFAREEEKKKKEWAALQDSFTGLDGGAKNWDQYDSDESEGGGKGKDSDDSDESGPENDQDDGIDGEPSDASSDDD